MNVDDELRKTAKAILAEHPEVDQVVVCSGSLGEALPRPEGVTRIVQHPSVVEPFVVGRQK